MAKKKTPFLDFYYKAMAEGSIQSQTTDYAKRVGIGGLCYTWIAELEAFKLIEISTLTYWGYSEDYCGGNDDDEIRFNFTSLRQTIILFCAAINNEL